MTEEPPKRSAIDPDLLALLEQLDDPKAFPPNGESSHSESPLDPDKVRTFKRNKQKALTTGDVASVFSLGCQLYKLGRGTTKDDHKACSLWKYAAGKGHVVATYNLGICHEFGDGVEANSHKAMQLYQQAHEKGFVDATFKLGRCYERGIGVKVNPSQAVEMYQQAYKKRHVQSTVNLGIFYENGIGVEKNPQRAVELYKEADEKGSVDGTFKLGLCYENGIGVEKNPERAVELYKQAHEKGNDGATYNLGVCFENGFGVEKNPKRAVELYKQAHEKGNDGATYNLGVCFENGFGVEKNPKRAVELYKQAHEKGNDGATYNLGVCFENGFGVEKNPKRAVELYKKARQKGNVGGTVKLGVCFERGIGVRMNPQRAVALYQRAYAKGDVEATVNLGVCYAKGVGVKVNSKRAFDLYQEAHEKGNKSATYHLGCFYRDGTCVEADFKKAFLLFQQAHEKGVVEATCDLGECYYYGIGVEQDFSTASDFTERAAKANLLQARHNLSLFFGPKINTKIDTIFIIQADIYVAEQLLKQDTIRDRDVTKYHLASLLCEESIGYKNFADAKYLLSCIPVSSKSYYKAQWLLCYIDNAWEYLAALEARYKSLTIDFISIDDVFLVAKIGNGYFTNVYLADHRGDWVAVKFMKVDLVVERRDIIRNFQRERLAWRMIEHEGEVKHVAEYIGFLDDRNGNVGLVFELCADISRKEFDAVIAKGSMSITEKSQDLSELPDWSEEVKSSLRSFVVHYSFRRPDVGVIVRMLANTARALQGLHKTGYIHRDIADRNILCDADMRVQLADLGLAKLVGLKIHEDDIMDSTELSKYAVTLNSDHQYPIAWWAPECIGNGVRPSIFSVESDVYSFGILMWQCFAHSDPFDTVLDEVNKSMDAKNESTAADKIAELILNGVRPDVNRMDSDTPMDLNEIILQCWATDPNLRPSMQHIIDELDRSAILPTKLSDGVQFSENMQKRKWFEVAKMYLTHPSKKARHLTEFRGSCSEHYQQAYKNMGHSTAPSIELPGDLIAKLGNRPVDIFMAHAGPRELESVTSIAELMECHGFRCFVDRNNTPETPQSEQMKFALETCRHIMLHVSKEFLRQKHLVQKLIASYLRMKWIRELYGWESLRIVLIDLTVEEFNGLWAGIAAEYGIETSPNDKLVLIEWNKSAAHWRSWLYKTKAQMVDCDKEYAIDKWRQFLHSDRSDLPSLWCSSSETMQPSQQFCLVM